MNLPRATHTNKSKVTPSYVFNEKIEPEFVIEEKKKNLDIRLEGECLVYNEYLCLYKPSRLNIRGFIDDFNKSETFKNHPEIDYRIRNSKTVMIGEDFYLFGEHYINFEDEETAFLARMIIVDYIR